jgi:hypothetical protein
MAEADSARAKARLLGALAVAALCGSLAAGAAPTAADPPANDGINCQPFGATPCLMPFPNDALTKKDKTTVTGRRLDLPQAAMPLGSQGRIDVGPYDMNDGFDPGSIIMTRAPGLDTPKALKKTGAVPQKDIAKYRAKNAPIAVIDAKTGKRQPIWVELDSTAPSVDTTALLIHPAKLLPEGRRYIVALRNLKNSKGKTLKAPNWFELLRDGKKLPADEKSQKRRYRSIFKSLNKAGFKRTSLYEAWDFTVASEKSLTHPTLSIRDDALKQLGDKKPGDGKVSGHAPEFTVDHVTGNGLAPGIALEVQGTFQVPCYLSSLNCAPGAAFNYGSGGGAYPTPKQMSGNFATAHYSCAIPNSATHTNKARPFIYGHGLFGEDTQAVDSGGGEGVSQLDREHNFLSCGTEWWGLAGDTSGDPGTENDIPTDVPVLLNLSLFPTVGDRLQQAYVNTIYLGRLMRRPDGFASNPNFQDGANKPLFQTDHLYYYGNSQGGIMGGGFTALEPDIRRSVLGVPGTDYGGLLLQRSSDYVGTYDVPLRASYQDHSQYVLILDLMEQLWDRGEAEAYAENMTRNPLPGTPSHKVLMHVAYGDHQVSMYSAAVEARTIGARAYLPHGEALDKSRLKHDRHLLYGLKALRLPFDGSGIVIWDSGPGRVDPPPYGNLQPTTANDPHGDPRKTVAARTQISKFLNDSTGRIVDTCSNAPCHTDAFVP